MLPNVVPWLQISDDYFKFLFPESPPGLGERHHQQRTPWGLHSYRSCWYRQEAGCGRVPPPQSQPGNHTFTLKTVVFLSGSFSKAGVIFASMCSITTLSSYSRSDKTMLCFHISGKLAVNCAHCKCRCRGIGLILAQWTLVRTLTNFHWFRADTVGVI